jgi:hypothetical protein
MVVVLKCIARAFCISLALSAIVLLERFQGYNPTVR